MKYGKAYTKCGDFFYSGKGIGGKRNKTEAFICYSKGAGLNDAESMNNLGLMMEQGGMVGNSYQDSKNCNPDLAMEWYKSAHKLGNTNATIN